jgi:hypothetical protein
MDSPHHQSQTAHLAVPCQFVSSSVVHNAQRDLPSWLDRTQFIPDHLRIGELVAHIHRPYASPCSNVQYTDCSVLWEFSEMELIIQKQ